MLKLRRVVQPLVCFALVFCSLLTAGSQTPAPRIRERITEGNRVALPGSRSPLADIGQDLGALPGDKTLQGITLVFKRSTAQQADLDQLLTAQGDAKSPLYHHWLAPDAFAARFGMADSDLAAAKAWLSSRGFTIDSVPTSRDRINFSGNAAQVEAAFSAGLHRFMVKGERHFGPARDLSLPAALAPVTASVLHLSDVRPQPQSHPLPAYTDGATGQHFLTPADLAIMYDLHASKTDGLTGQGQSIAIVGESYVDLSLYGLDTLQQAQGYGIGASLVLVPGSGVEATSPGNLAESQLDLEYAAGTAPLAQLYLVFVGDNPDMNVFDALTFAIQQNIAPVVSISYGLCEAFLNPSAASSANQLFQQAAAQGQTLVAASGDNGSTDCAPYTSSSLTAAQKSALQVSFPASNPLVTAVGGTQMAPNTYNSGANQFWSATSTPGLTSLLSYVPEVAWNEDVAAHAILAGGGGASAFFPRPSWQNSFPSIPSGTGRLLPDVALQSATRSPGLLLCTNDIAYVGPQGVDSCYNYVLNNNGYYASGGGTSFATPVFAGSVALLNEYEQEQGQGPVNATLYQLASNPSTYASAFHDITSGSIACVSGIPGCTAAGEAGFSAGPGFDEATGLGSLDFANLRAAWPLNTQVDRTRQTLYMKCSISGVDSPNPDPGGPGQAFCTLEPLDSSHTPGTGTVSAFLDQAPIGGGSPIPLDPKSATNFTLSFTAPSAPGSHLIRISYPGDATHLPLTMNFPFMVGAVQASGSFTLSASNLTFSNNATGTATVMISPAATNGYHGELYWNLSATQTSGSSSPTLCYAIDPVRVNGATSTTLSFGAGTACNAPLPSSRVASRSLSIQSRAALQPFPQKRSLPIYAALLGTGLIVTRSRRKRFSGLSGLACLALLAVLPLVGGCGGGATSSAGGTSGGSGSGGSGGSGSGGSGSGGTGTPTAQPAVFTLTLYGNDSVSSTVGANTTLTLTVN